MFTAVTYQDWCASETPYALLLDVVQQYKLSEAFRTALDADAYFAGQNTSIGRKTILSAERIETTDQSGRRRFRPMMQDVVGNRIRSGFLFRFVTQQNQYLLSDGVILKNGQTKKALGADIDHLLEQMGEKALLHGVCWGFWNVDHLEMIEAVRGPLSGFVALRDEMSGDPRVGIQFWQIDATRPMYIRLFETEGMTLLRQDGKELIPLQPRQPYRVTEQRYADGEITCQQHNWPALPVLPLYANAEKRSELTPAIRSKIDAYDNILSDFADNLDRANDIYWVLNNFGGTMDDVAALMEQINRLKAVASFTDGTGSSATAEPHTMEVPYEARQTALKLLERELYRDYMALDMDQLTGGSLTNVAIRTATAALNLKADRYEWQVIQFIRRLLQLLDLPDEPIRFRRQAIANESETVADIVAMRADIDQRTALALNPYIQEEEIDMLIQSKQNELRDGAA